MPFLLLPLDFDRVPLTYAEDYSVRASLCTGNRRMRRSQPCSASVFGGREASLWRG